MKKMFMKKIAFIIAALNEEKNVGLCIDSIKKNTYKNKEIILVDGGSKDRTAEIAKKKGAIVLNEEGKNKCPANAWNQAVKYTDAELVCLLGADFILPDEKYAEKAAKALEDKKVACVYTEVRTEEETLIEKIVSCFEPSLHPNVFRKEIFEKIWGFPVMGFGEDRIFNMRFLKYIEENNMRAEYLHDTYYSGHTVQNLRALYKQAKWYGRTSVLYLKEHNKESGSIIATLKESLTVNFKMGYFMLFTASLVFFRTPLFYYFFLPFFIIAAGIIIKNFKRPYHTLKVFTNIVSGFGFFIGIVSYAFGLNKGRGRG